MAFKEKRREERFKVDMVCNIEDFGEINIVDISKGGVGLLGKEGLIEGKAVDLTIDLDGEQMPIRGVVVFCKEKESGVRYGVEIVKYPESWLNLIYRHMMKNR